MLTVQLLWGQLCFERPLGERQCMFGWNDKTARATGRCLLKHISTCVFLRLKFPSLLPQLKFFLDVGIQLVESDCLVVNRLWIPVSQITNCAWVPFVLSSTASLEGPWSCLCLALSYHMFLLERVSSLLIWKRKHSAEDSWKKCGCHLTFECPILSFF